MEAVPGAAKEAGAVGKEDEGPRGPPLPRLEKDNQRRIRVHVVSCCLCYIKILALVRFEGPSTLCMPRGFCLSSKSEMYTSSGEGRMANSAVFISRIRGSP